MFHWEVMASELLLVSETVSAVKKDWTMIAVSHWDSNYKLAMTSWTLGVREGWEPVVFSNGRPFLSLDVTSHCELSLAELHLSKGSRYFVFTFVYISFVNTKHWNDAEFWFQVVSFPSAWGDKVPELGLKGFSNQCIDRFTDAVCMHCWWWLSPSTASYQSWSH